MLIGPDRVIAEEGVDNCGANLYREKIDAEIRSRLRYRARKSQ